MCEREKCKTPREFRVFFRDVLCCCCCYHWHSIVFPLFLNESSFTPHSHRLISFMCFLSRIFLHFTSFISGGVRLCVEFSCAMNFKREHDDVVVYLLIFFSSSRWPLSPAEIVCVCFYDELLLQTFMKLNEFSSKL